MGMKSSVAALLASKILIRGGPAFHDGLSANFLNSTFYTRPAGGALTRFAGPSTLFNNSFALGARTELGGSGYYVDYAANSPALTWTESGQAVGIRLEGAGTNLALRGDKLFGADVPWQGDTSGGLVGTADDDYVGGVIGPDGVLNSATRIVCDRQGGSFSRWQNPMAVASAAYTNSMVARTLGGGTSNVNLRVVSQNQLKSVTGAFRRFSNYNSTPTTAPNLQIISFATAGGDVSFDILARYGQVEANPFPTSIIRTTGLSPVTRNADTLVRNVGSEFSATANTYLVSGYTPAGKSAGDQTLFIYDDDTSNNRQMLVRDNAGVMRFIVTSGGVEQCNLNLGTVADQAVFAVAIRAEANSFAASLNGNSCVTDASGSVPSGLTRFRLGHGLSGAHWYGTCARFEQYPSAFTNAALEVAAANFFSDLGVQQYAPNNAAIQTAGFVSLSEQSATRLRGVRSWADGQGYQHANPGARVSFKTNSPWLQYDVAFNGLITRLDVYNDAIVTVVDGTEVDSFDPGIAPNVTASYTRFLTLGAAGTDRTITIIWPYWAAIDLTKIRVASGSTFTAPSAVPSAKLIVAGDSITQGAFASKVSMTWAHKLAGLMNAELISMGYGSALGGSPPGANIGAIAAPHGSNAYVVYTIGVNNYLNQLSLTTFKTNVANWYSAVRSAAPNAKIVLVGPFYLNPASPYNGVTLTIPMSDYRAKIAEVKTDNSGDTLLEYVDGGSASVMTNADTRLNADKIHPNDTGHNEIAAGLQIASTLLP